MQHYNSEHHHQNAHNSEVRYFCHFTSSANVIRKGCPTNQPLKVKVKDNLNGGVCLIKKESQNMLLILTVVCHHEHWCCWLHNHSWATFQKYPHYLRRLTNAVLCFVLHLELEGQHDSVINTYKNTKLFSTEITLKLIKIGPMAED
jgi:hypothetical protein